MECPKDLGNMFQGHDRKIGCSHSYHLTSVNEKSIPLQEHFVPVSTPQAAYAQDVIKLLMQNYSFCFTIQLSVYHTEP